jgi:hypothetical protein
MSRPKKGLEAPQELPHEGQMMKSDMGNLKIKRTGMSALDSNDMEYKI